MSTSLMPWIPQQYLNSDGNPLSGGSVFIYFAGTSNPAPSYSDQAGTVLNPVPNVELNGAGYPNNASKVIYLDQALTYDIIVKDVLGVVQFSRENVVGSNGSGSSPSGDYILKTTTPLVTQIINTDLVSDQVISDITKTGTVSLRDGKIQVKNTHTSVSNSSGTADLPVKGIVANTGGMSGEVDSSLTVVNQGLGEPKVTVTEVIRSKTSSTEIDLELVKEFDGQANEFIMYDSAHGRSDRFAVLSDIPVVPDLGDYIRKDGLTDTTATIPFAEGLIITGTIQDGQEGSIRLVDNSWISATTNTGAVNLIGGLDAANARFTATATQASILGSGLVIGQTNLDGSSLKIPDGSWIRPQTAQGGLYLTNGSNPSASNSVLHLTNSGSLFSCGDGVDQFGQISIGSGGVNIYHNESGSSNSSVSLYNNYVSLYSGDSSNVALSSNSATMYGGDSNLTLNDTYASLYQAGIGFYIDSTGIKPQGINPGTVATNGFVGLNSAGYLVKTPALTTTTAGILTRIYLNPLDVIVDGTTYNTLTSDGAGATNETQSVSSNNTLQTFATSFISDGYLTDGIIHAGGYTANMWVNTNNCNHEVDYYIDVYLTDTLGVNLLLLGTLASGGLVLRDNNDHTIQLTAYTPADVPYVTGQRIKFVVKAIANTGGGGGPHTLSIKYGLTHVSYIDIPVDITTDMVTDTRNGQILTASLDNLIAKDGTITTTAPIPFAEGLSVASVFEVTDNGTINSQAPINVRTTIGDDLCLQLDHVSGDGYLVSKNTTLDQSGLFFRFYGDLDLDFGTLVTDPKFNIKTKVQLPNIATGSVVSGGFVGLDANNILVKTEIAYGDITGTPALNFQPLDADLTAIAGLSADGLLRKTSGVWGMDSTIYVTQTALDLKANIASPTFTGTVSGITSAMVGLGNVDNTSDANKPVSTATQTALNLKANIASPTFTGNPLAPTPALGDNDTSIATTAFVRSAINSVTAVASTATLTVNSLTTTQANITAQAVALNIASPTGGVDGRKLIFRIKDNGTARGITWDGIFRVIGVTLPLTTVAGKILYVGAIYNAAETKWDVVSVAVQA